MKKNFFIYLISRVFLPGLFLNFLAHCAIAKTPIHLLPLPHFFLYAHYLLYMYFFSAIHLLEKRQLVTCPGFPGYCSESYPGGVCTVVCAFGRPNVPECQVITFFNLFISYMHIAYTYMVTGGGAFLNNKLKALVYILTM